MRFSQGFINIWPLEFLGFGSLWVPFGPWIDVFSCVYWHFPSWHEVFSWVYQHLTLRIPWLWIPWVPFGPLWGHCGSPWPPLGTILDDFCIVLGPSDHKSSPEGDEFKMLGLFLLVFGDILWVWTMVRQMFHSGSEKYFYGYVCDYFSDYVYVWLFRCLVVRWLYIYIYILIYVRSYVTIVVDRFQGWNMMVHMTAALS